MYRSLDAHKIIATIETLRARITDRFPDSGVGKVCGELLDIARESQKRCEWIRSPLKLLRAGVGLIIVLIVGGVIETLMQVDFGQVKFHFADFVQVMEAGTNELVLVGASIIFLVTVEKRVKRSRSVKAINELRTLAQVIDMHQLTKDPERVLGSWATTPHSPKETLNSFQLIRYLDYCSEMLSLSSKVGALYGQSFPDDAVLGSIHELETLTTGLSSKIWQKIAILHSFESA